MKQAIFLSNKYEIVITNPPYMGGNGMNKKLSNFLKNNYTNSKKDLFAAFIEKGLHMIKENMFNVMVTMQSWMFLSSYEKMRKEILKNYVITNMLHMENMVMGIAFGTSATVFRKIKMPQFKGIYNQIKLQDIDSNNISHNFPVHENNNNIVNAESFSSIPGSPIAYWAEPELINAFREGKKLLDYAETKKGMYTGNNSIFLRYWYEIDFNDFLKKFMPYTKGGGFRKWYGNNEYVIDWENNGERVKNYKRSGGVNDKYFFKKCCTWGALTSSKISFRGILTNNFVISNAGPALYPNDEDLLYMLGCLNTNVADYILNIMNPTLNNNPGVISNFPLIYEPNQTINNIVSENIELTKNDWDEMETSWDFEKNPLLNLDKKIEDSLNKRKIELSNRFSKLKQNENKLNEIFKNIYRFNNCLLSEIEDKYISINQVELTNEIKNFISYFIGCLFGRYSLNQEGLIYAGGQYEESNYNKFIPDKDNIIPILDTEYFSDDIVKTFEEFLKIAFSEETLEENIKFIANALGNKGKNYRDTIRKYFLKDFFNNHKKMYKKTPIYWQFDSGKEDGFKALIYMHRYTPDTVARVRTDYLHPLQKALEDKINNNEQIIINSDNSKERSQSTKENFKLKKQLEETHKYDEALGHVANQQIAIDLDDGVKHNYELFQNVEVGNKKINLLKKI